MKGRLQRSERSTLWARRGALLLAMLGVCVVGPPRAVATDEKEALISPEARSFAPRAASRALGNPANLLFPLDATYTLVDFFGDGPTGNGPATGPDQQNDDDSATVPLPFSFDLYGDLYATAYVNNNGNLSFATPFSTFTATGFPDPEFRMVAPFWADVDTRGAFGQVWQKLSGNTLVVTWDNVGYYNIHGDKRNTFQVAISDGNDPTMGIGNNVCFSYDEMEWTTGDASGGIGGFGGTPATVGANRGNGVDFFQIGRFDHDGVDYDGPGGANDGVSYLDGRRYCLSTSTTTSNISPIPAGFPPANHITLNCLAGDILNLDLSFLSPEQGQTTTVTVDDPNGAGADWTGCPTAGMPEPMSSGSLRPTTSTRPG